MQAMTLLARRLIDGMPQMHALRLNVLLAAVAALMQHPTLSISALGRALSGQAKPKHRIKRIDRLIGNPHLMQERRPLYGLLCHWLLQGMSRPLIVVDWSDATPDRQWQLLRAALPTQGRTLTLYEEVHPLQHLSNRRVQTAFLNELKALLPPECRPILLTDAGFSTPWFRAVEERGWSWLGRLRGQEYVRWLGETEWWQGRLLYALALRRPKTLGEVEIVRSSPTRCGLFLLRRPKRGRIKRTRYGHAARSKHSQKNASRERAPWLLATSPDLADRPATQIMTLYRRRMQIEEAFRDLKSHQVGLGFGQTQSRQQERIANLLLLAALALLLLWLIGQAIRRRGLAGNYQSNSRRRRSLSIIQLGLLGLAQPPPCSALQQALAALQQEVAHA